MARERSDDLARMETIAFITAGGLAVATVATYFLWPEGPRPEQHGARVSPHLTTSVGKDRAGLVLMGAF